MTDRRTGMPIDSDEPDKQGQAVQGMSGERSVDPSVDRPEHRRTIETEERTIEVEEVSGTAFAEAKGAIDMRSPDPGASSGEVDNTSPVDPRT